MPRYSTECNKLDQHVFGCSITYNHAGRGASLLPDIVGDWEIVATTIIEAMIKRAGSKL